MRPRLLLASLLACAMLFACAMCAASEQAPPAAASSTGGVTGQPASEQASISPTGEGAFSGGAWSEKVSLDFKDTPVTEVVPMLLKGTGISFVFSPDVPKDLRVTMSLQNIERKDALKQMCYAFDLDYRLENSVVQIQRRAAPEPVPAGGPYPFLTRSQVFTKEGGRATATTTHYIDIGNAILTARATARCESFSGDDILVDLEVKDAPISEAMSQISKAGLVRIRVHESVPKDIKITARMYKVPLGDMLCLIVGQAKLEYVVFTGGGVLVEVVPKSELTVSGPDIPGGTVSVSLPRSDIDYRERLKQMTDQLVTLRAEAGPVECPKCHRKVLAIRDYKFCPYCGAQLPPAKSTTGAKSK